MTTAHVGVGCGGDRFGGAKRCRVVALVPVAVSLALLAASCGRGTASSEGALSEGASTEVGTSARRGALSGTIVVSAASSLAAPFERMAEEFVAANPGVEVDLNLDGSSSLVTQVLEGAPADVFAPADLASIDRVSAAGLLAGGPQAFATNELVIVARPGNPAGIGSLEDLKGVGVVALCGVEVPCGRYAQQVLSKAGVRLDESTVTRGRNARATLAAVAEGDAVAGIVYDTDATGSGDAVAPVPIPPEANVVATYPIGVVSTSTNARLAQAFVAWVVGPAGRAVLAEFGFGPPP